MFVRVDLSIDVALQVILKNVIFKVRSYGLQSLGCLWVGI